MDALRNLDAWKQACRLSADVYQMLAASREWGFRDQLSRSALSIASNIAEGYGRESVLERVHFLRIAKGSCNETWTQLLIGIEAGILDREKAVSLAGDVQRIAKMIGGLIRYLDQKDRH